MNSIRRQLTRTFLTGFGLLLAGGGTAIYFFTRLALTHEFDARLRAQALTIMSQTELADSGDHIQVDLPDTFFPSAHNDAMPPYYELWQTNGAVGLRSPSLKELDLPRRFGSAATPVYWNLDLPGDQDGRAIGLQFKLKAEDGEPHRAGPEELVLVVAASRHPLDDTLATLATVLAATGLLTIIVTVPLVRYSLQRGQAPLGELARQAAAINADSLQSRFPVATLPEELQPIPPA